MTQKCICCHKEKDIKLFKEKCKTCKLCKWFKKHQLNIPDDWNEDDILYRIRNE